MPQLGDIGEGLRSLSYFAYFLFLLTPTAVVHVAAVAGTTDQCTSKQGDIAASSASTYCAYPVIDDPDSLSQGEFLYKYFGGPDPEPVLIRGAIRHWQLFQDIQRDGATSALGLAARLRGSAGWLNWLFPPTGSTKVVVRPESFLEHCVNRSKGLCLIRDLDALTSEGPTREGEETSTLEDHAGEPGKVFDDRFGPFLVESGSIVVPRFLQGLEIQDVWFSYGPKGAQTGFHDHGPTCFGILDGKKLWNIWTPQRMKDMIVNEDPRIFFPMFDKKPLGVRKYLAGKKRLDLMPTNCTQQAGDLLCLPSGIRDDKQHYGFMHGLLDIIDSVGVAFHIEPFIYSHDRTKLFRGAAGHLIRFVADDNSKTAELV